MTRSTEKWDGDEWVNGPSLPEGRARYVLFYPREHKGETLYCPNFRFCAVALDESSIAVIGGEVPGQAQGIAISSEMKTYNIDNAEWETNSGAQRAF